jgi:hypothetical protein
LRKLSEVEGSGVAMASFATQEEMDATRRASSMVSNAVEIAADVLHHRAGSREGPLFIHSDAQ